MEIFLGIVFLFAGIFNMTTPFIMDYYKNLKNKIVIWASIILAGVCFGIAFNYFVAYNVQKEYPASEYTMSIKTTTMDNHTDTTYVITKIL